jgi:hypothetical protein
VVSKAETPVEIAKESLIPWPQSVDSQLWNDRVEYLINRLVEAERKKNEPQTSEG